MIALADIFKSVCNSISESTDIQIIDSDTEEPVERPSFKIFMDTVKTDFFSSRIRSIRVYFNCYYYARDRNRNKAEIFEIEDKLSTAFLEPLFIKNSCAVYVDNLDFEKVEDGILNCSFDFEIGTEFIDESDLETMKELRIKL
ncbi:MAG: DUF6838 family protein [Lachnospirales bacterium]